MRRGKKPIISSVVTSLRLYLMMSFCDITDYGFYPAKGNDYIKFLLSKFSAKSIFEKVAVVAQDEPDLRSH